MGLITGLARRLAALPHRAWTHPTWAEPLGRLADHAWRRARPALERLAYRRREVSVIAAMAASLLGGLVVERWRGVAPDALARLEAESARAARAALPARRQAAPRALAETRGRPRCGERSTPAGPGRPSMPRSPATPLDVNGGTVEQLAALPGIGPRLAERIVARRDAQPRGFESHDDLLTVRGLGARKLAGIVGLITLRAPGPRASAAPRSGRLEADPHPHADPAGPSLAGPVPPTTPLTTEFHP
jgi:DNA uptake protein ComE-like DNA-binding protein